ncbi:hypothetical protein ACA910_015261 [Epithemia clementina (nom. ined.)]
MNHPTTTRYQESNNSCNNDKRESSGLHEGCSRSSLRRVCFNEANNQEYFQGWELHPEKDGEESELHPETKEEDGEENNCTANEGKDYSSSSNLEKPHRQEQQIESTKQGLWYSRQDYEAFRSQRRLDVVVAKELFQMAAEEQRYTQDEPASSSSNALLSLQKWTMQARSLYQDGTNVPFVMDNAKLLLSSSSSSYSKYVGTTDTACTMTSSEDENTISCSDSLPCWWYSILGLETLILSDIRSDLADRQDSIYHVVAEIQDECDNGLWGTFPVPSFRTNHQRHHDYAAVIRTTTTKLVEFDKEDDCTATSTTSSDDCSSLSDEESILPSESSHVIWKKEEDEDDDACLESYQEELRDSCRNFSQANTLFAQVLAHMQLHDYQ